MNIMDPDEILRAQLARLRTEHRQLDEQIAAFHGVPRADHLELRRLKKTKLRLKDEIARIEDTLYPDIIA